ncbi:MAG: LPS export ABC transporter periplasmic protein LptC [Paludibacteraceae bacterium]|nr:LPS export ABC transporter periplasmic protein LptC [Paludibacteraceae bacterium]
MWTVVMLFFVGCSSSIKKGGALSGSRDSVPVMVTYDVNTVISDSGVTRYRVTSPEWAVYDRAAEPCWIFPKGLHLEKFDENLDVYAKVDADSAIYFSNLEIWHLVGHVNAMNVEGEHFESELLIVSQKEDRVYTDKFIKITQKKRIINGTGFESNQNLSRYTILNPQGVFPIDDDEDAAADSLDSTL